MDVTLYHFRLSSSSWRVRWALAFKGVAHRTVSVDLRAGEQHAPEHLARSPRGYVPVLSVVTGGRERHLWESVAIFEYLDETVPEPPLYPRDPWARARVRQVVELINSGVQPYQNLEVLGRHAAAPEEQQAWARDFNQRGMAALEHLLDLLAEERGGPGRFAAGDDLTAADLFLVPQVASARRFGVDLDAFPRVVAVEQAALATEDARSAHPDAFRA